MKTLKFNHRSAELIINGQMTTTWRLFDDKDLSVDNKVTVIDKVNPKDPTTWRSIGIATISKVIEKHLEDVSEVEVGEGAELNSRPAILKICQHYYGSNVSLKTPVKIVFFIFSPNSLLETKIALSPKTKKAIVYADGASRGNPGPSASGYAIYDSNHVLLVSQGSYIGITTNNQAEYTALKLALEKAKALGISELDVYMDSLLVINQMKGVFKVKNRDLWPIHNALKGLCVQFSHINFTQIPREMNKLADTAANNALDEHQTSLHVRA
jgi:ribonuclease HI